MRPKINNADIQLGVAYGPDGKRVALAIGNENCSCPFYLRGDCHHCDIGEGEGLFTPDMNLERLEWLKDYFKDDLQDAEHLLVYNSGSVLDQREMSRRTLGTILGYISSLDKCKVVSLDSREMYVTKDSLDYVVKSLREDQQARIILGIESQNDEIRIGKLNKRMTKGGIERLFSNVGEYNGEVGIDVNIVFQPPELTGEEAIQEVVETMKYGLELSEQYGVPVDFNFHPYYQSERSGKMFPDHPRANLRDAKEALGRMKMILEEKASNSKIFIGWQDEEHDQEQDVKVRELERELERYNQINVSQNVRFLE